MEFVAFRLNLMLALNDTASSLVQGEPPKGVTLVSSAGQMAAMGAGPANMADAGIAALVNAPYAIERAAQNGDYFALGEQIGGLTFFVATAAVGVEGTVAKIGATGDVIGSIVVDGSGSALNVPKTIPYQPTGSFINQGKAPVCGPACAAMTITDKTGISISLQDAISSFGNGIRSTGVSTTELSNVISNAGILNKVNTTMLPGELTQALRNGNTVIVNVNSHFFIVDSVVTVDGFSYYMTRDPHAGPRGVLASMLDNAMKIGINAIIIGE